MFKSHDFYAMPRQFENNALTVKEITELPRARVEFGRYDTTEDITLLQPVKELTGGEPLFGILKFDFNTSDFKKEIIYIDNYDIYGISKINNDEIIKLTNEHMYSLFVRDYNIMSVSYKFSFHPFNERITK